MGCSFRGITEIECFCFNYCRPKFLNICLILDCVNNSVLFYREKRKIYILARQFQLKMAALLTSFEDQVAFHSLQAKGINSAAHHGVPHHTLVAVDVHQTVVTRNLGGEEGKRRR